MKKKFLAVCALFVAAACLPLAGCGTEQGESSPEPAASAGGGTALEEKVDAFQEELGRQESLTLEQFQSNYETGRQLLEEGASPVGRLGEYSPEDDGGAPGDGLYVLRLDSEIYGVSDFFVIPAGLRAMTAEEYLELAQTAALPGEELVKPENSWTPFQENRGVSNRPMSAKERFWSMYQFYEPFSSQELGNAADNPVTIPVGCGGQESEFTIYPTADMSGPALQNAMLALYNRLPEEQQALYYPKATELTRDDAAGAAAEAVAEHAGRTDAPDRSYALYSRPALSAEQDTGSGIWMVGLYFEDGGSYGVNLDAATGEINTVVQLPEGCYDFPRPWAEGEPAPQGTVIFSK